MMNEQYADMHTLEEDDCYFNQITNRKVNQKYLQLTKVLAIRLLIFNWEDQTKLLKLKPNSSLITNPS